MNEDGLRGKKLLGNQGEIVRKGSVFKPHYHLSITIRFTD